MRRARVVALHICVVLALATAHATVPVHNASAQDAAPSPGAKPAQTAPRPAVPPPESLLILVRTTLIALAHANQTGNYTVLRDLGSPSFQGANSAARLGQIFNDLRSRGVNLSSVAVLTPELTKSPAINNNGMLLLVGYFPSKPQQIHFQTLYQPVNGRWRLFGISVFTKPPTATAAARAKKTKKKATRNKPQ